MLYWKALCRCLRWFSQVLDKLLWNKMCWKFPLNKNSTCHWPSLILCSCLTSTGYCPRGQFVYLRTSWVFWPRRPVYASKLPGPLHNTARSVPSGPVAGASTNTVSHHLSVLHYWFPQASLAFRHGCSADRITNQTETDFEKGWEWLMWPV